VGQLEPSWSALKGTDPSCLDPLDGWASL
jgi:hypothetical protein